MRVVIAIDDSKFSKAVLEAVAHRDWTAGATLLVLNVLSAPTPEHLSDIGLGLDKELRAQFRLKQEELLERSVSYLKDHLAAGLKVSMASAEGHAAENILKVATDWQADLIILGSHGYTGIAKAVLGSVAEAVLVSAPCSVEIIRQRKEKDRLAARAKKKRMHVLY